MRKWFPKILLVALVLVLLLPQIQGSAQRDLEQFCSPQNLESNLEGLSRQKKRSLLRDCLDYYEQQNEQIEGKISETRQQKQNLENKIWSLNQEIRNLNNEIQQSNLVIRDLGFQVEDTEESIKETSIKIQESTRELSGILRAIHEQNKKTTVEVLLAEDKLSSFFNNLVSLEVLSSRNKKLLKDIKDLKEYLKKQEQALREEKSSLESVVKTRRSQKYQSQQIREEKENLKEMTEVEYQQYLAEKQQTEERIEDISSKLWETLVGVREIPEYGKAVEVAQGVEEQTGVRAAFILAILTQESRIGRNVGQCMVKDFDTGMGVKADTGKKWPRVMKPGRDIPVFRDVVEKLNKQQNLGMDPKSTLVSCWIPSCYKGNDIIYDATVNQGNINCNGSGYKPFGWGGAMGPAQFIPSTWDIYDEDVAKITGTAPDPWNFSDATLAAGVLLKDEGAVNDERGAAVGYLGADYLGYADNVLSLAECHQSYIDNGSMSASCQERIGLK